MTPSVEEVKKHLIKNRIISREDWTGKRCFLYWEGRHYCYDSQHVFYVDGCPTEIDWELDIFRNIRSLEILKRIAECSDTK